MFILQKIIHSIGLIALVELVLLYLWVFVHNMGGSFFDPYGTPPSDLEEIILFFEVTIMYTAPLLIPLLMFKDALTSKIGKGLYSLAMLIILGSGLTLFAYFVYRILGE